MVSNSPHHALGNWTTIPGRECSARNPGQVILVSAYTTAVISSRKANRIPACASDRTPHDHRSQKAPGACRNPPGPARSPGNASPEKPCPVLASSSNSDPSARRSCYHALARFPPRHQVRREPGHPPAALADTGEHGPAMARVRDDFFLFPERPVVAAHRLKRVLEPSHSRHPRPG